MRPVHHLSQKCRATVTSFGCRCEVCAGPQAGGADSREGQQSSDGAHSTASSQTLWQVRPTAAAPAWSTQHQLAGGGVFVSAPPSGGLALQLFTRRDAAHQTQLTCRVWNLSNTCVRGCYVILWSAECPFNLVFTVSGHFLQLPAEKYRKMWTSINKCREIFTCVHHALHTLCPFNSVKKPELKLFFLSVLFDRCDPSA